MDNDVTNEERMQRLDWQLEIVEWYANTCAKEDVTNDPQCRRKLRLVTAFIKTIRMVLKDE